MGWGIRGQYGHETGAMIPGLLLGLVFAILFQSNGSLNRAFFSIAWITLGISLGGSMTYGQTIGLTQNPPLLGNSQAWAWGMLGLAIKGGLWIGFAGLFWGLSVAKKPKPLEMVGIAFFLPVAFSLGCLWFHEPFQPELKKLPWIYFSADWRWGLEGDIKPRREVWGGLVLAFVGLCIWNLAVRRTPLPVQLGLWGLLGGAVGFPLGQCLQAYHAWHKADFAVGFWAQWDPFINWWNTMETTFGGVMGAILGLGAWVHQKSIVSSQNGNLQQPDPHWSLSLGEWGLLGLHGVLLVWMEFGESRQVDWWYAHGVGMVLLPILALAAGTWSPYLISLPFVCLVIAGKTLVEMVYKKKEWDPMVGWLDLLVLPVSFALIWAIALKRGSPDQGVSIKLRATLISQVWLYFYLNFVFFQFPYPWREWTGRTLHGLVYLGCALGLTLWAILGKPAIAEKSRPPVS